VNIGLSLPPTSIQRRCPCQQDTRPGLRRTLPRIHTGQCLCFTQKTVSCVELTHCPVCSNNVSGYLLSVNNVSDYRFSIHGIVNTSPQLPCIIGVNSEFAPLISTLYFFTISSITLNAATSSPWVGTGFFILAI